MYLDYNSEAILKPVPTCVMSFSCPGIGWNRKKKTFSALRISTSLAWFKSIISVLFLLMRSEYMVGDGRASGMYYIRLTANSGSNFITTKKGRQTQRRVKRMGQIERSGFSACAEDKNEQKKLLLKSRSSCPLEALDRGSVDCLVIAGR